MSTNKQFSPVYVRCNKCLSVIHSSYEGEYVRCACRAIAVDQTKYYTRFIGNEEDYSVHTYNPNGYYIKHRDKNEHKYA